MSNSTVKKTRRKPEKPYEGFPLFPHASGQWAKKIRGKLHYFGVWDDPDAALERLNRELPYLKDGREVPTVDVSSGCTLHLLCNAFLAEKEGKHEAGELSPRTYRDYFKTCKSLIDYFGKTRRVDDLRPDDFLSYRSQLSKRLGPVSLGNEINRVRIVFRYAKENDLIEKSVRFGSGFKRPSQKILRKSKNEGGVNLYTRDEVLQILAEADPVMRAMCLLGLNCGFGNTDVASLPRMDGHNGDPYFMAADYQRLYNIIAQHIPGVTIEWWEKTTEDQRTVCLATVLQAIGNDTEPATEDQPPKKQAGRPSIPIKVKIKVCCVAHARRKVFESFSSTV